MGNLVEEFYNKEEEEGMPRMPSEYRQGTFIVSSGKESMEVPLVVKGLSAQEYCQSAIDSIEHEGKQLKRVGISPPKDCPVNKPSHYKKNPHDIECLEAIQASMSSGEFEGYLKGNVLKYVWRYRYKGKPLEDLRKAESYLKNLINVTSGGKLDVNR